MKTGFLFLPLIAASCFHGIYIEDIGKVVPETEVRERLLFQRKAAFRALKQGREASRKKAVWFQSLSRLSEEVQSDVTQIQNVQGRVLGAGFAAILDFGTFPLNVLNIIYYPVTEHTLFYTLDTEVKKLGHRERAFLLLYLSGEVSGSPPYVRVEHSADSIMASFEPDEFSDVLSAANVSFDELTLDDADRETLRQNGYLGEAPPLKKKETDRPPPEKGP